MGPTWGPPGSCQPQMGPMLAPWTLLSGTLHKKHTESTPASLSMFVHTLPAIITSWNVHRSFIPWSPRPQEFIPIIIFQACFYQSSGGPWSAIKTYLFRNSAMAQTWGHYGCFHEIITSFMWSFYGWVLIVNQNSMIRLWSDTLTQEYQSTHQTISSLLSVPQASKSCC